MKLINKILNHFGYYHTASSNYYLSSENNKPVMVNKENYAMTHKFDTENVENAVYNLLNALGQDVNRPGLVETPRRVAKYWKELLEGEQYTNEQIANMYNKSFVVPGDSLVVVKVEDVFSHCEHHLALMYNGTAYIAYIPKKVDGGYKVLGLSKIPRIVHMCAKRLQLEEKLASDICECIQIATGSDEVYVQLVMEHGCMSARGIRSQGETDSTFMTDKLKQNKQARMEIESKISNLY